MRIEILRAFLITVQENSLTKAADRLFISQSTISRYIQDLEKELNCQLFIRSRQGIKPTPAALVIYGQIQKLVNDWEQIQFEASQSASPDGTIRLGYVYPHVLPYVSKAIDDLSRSCQEDITISLTYGQAFEICQMVQNGLLDCAIIHRPSVIDEGDLLALRLYPSSVGIMVPKVHPLAIQKQIEMKQLCEEIECRVQRDPEYYAAIDNAFFTKGLNPPKHVMCSYNADCYMMIRRNGYFGFRLSLYPPEEGCVTLPVKDWPVDCDLMFIRNKNNPRPLLEHFYNVFQRSFIRRNAE